VIAGSETASFSATILNCAVRWQKSMTKKVDRFAGIPSGANALCFASWIHRRVEPRQWTAALLDVPEQHRHEAETYLRGIAARMRVVKIIGEDRK
jgi:hypothetical protein